MLYIMRHGQTDWNVKHKLQGKTNISLNEFGRVSSIEAGKQYSEVNIDICYCSPLDRAQETAKLFIGDRDIPIVTDNRLEEMGFGIYEGEEKVFDKPDCPVREFFFNPGEYKAVGGAESIDQVLARTGEFLNEVIYPELEKGKDILIVAHGALNAGLLCHFRNRSKAEFWDEPMENCKLIKVL